VLTARIEKLRAGVPEEPSGTVPAEGFRVGTVVVVETAKEDYRYLLGTDPDLFNELGCETLAAVARGLSRLGSVPKVLAFPAGTFFGELESENDAAKLVTSLVGARKGLKRELAGLGSTAIVVGVDDRFSEPYLQVPVVIEVTGDKVNIRPLARRFDFKDVGQIPSSFLGSRSLTFEGLTTYVAYCGEIGAVNANGQVRGIQLAGSKHHDVAIDLGHYFRQKDAFVYEDDTGKSGIGFFLRACANAAAPDRLNAPVVVSTALVGREPLLDVDDHDRPTFCLGLRSKARDRPNAKLAYWRPTVIQEVRTPSSNGEGDALLTINLFQ